MKTLAANLAAVNANKKKENPYLAHRAAPVQPVVAVAATPTSISVPLVGSSSSAAPVVAPGVAAENLVVTDEIIVDERLPSRKREMKGKKALQFVEPGKFIKEATRLQEKEEKKAIAGYASGRKQLEKVSLHLVFLLILISFLPCFVGGFDGFINFIARIFILYSCSCCSSCRRNNRRNVSFTTCSTTY